MVVIRREYTAQKFSVYNDSTNRMQIKISKLKRELFEKQNDSKKNLAYYEPIASKQLGQKKIKKHNKKYFEKKIRA